MNERPSDDSTSVARAVEQIEGASFVFAVVLIFGPVWSLVVPFAGWGFLTWTLGAAVWCFLPFLAVRNVQSLPCPRCRGALASPPMTAAELEALLRYVALPPLTLALRARYLRRPRVDSIASAVAAEELAAVERRRARLAREGWWN